MMEITKRHRELVGCVKKILDEWHKFTIAIDGVDGSGKSTLARFLSWQTDISVIETDMFLNMESENPSHRFDDLKAFIGVRHDNNRPIIIEGRFMLKLLENVNIIPDYIIYVSKRGHEGSIIKKHSYGEYKREYQPISRANFVYQWSED